jgi:hypothetical protein
MPADTGKQKSTNCVLQPWKRRAARVENTVRSYTAHTRGLFDRHIRDMGKHISVRDASNGYLEEPGFLNCMFDELFENLINADSHI